MIIEVNVEKKQETMTPTKETTTKDMEAKVAKETTEKENKAASASTASTKESETKQTGDFASSAAAATTTTTTGTTSSSASPAPVPLAASTFTQAKGLREVAKEEAAKAIEFANALANAEKDLAEFEQQMQARASVHKIKVQLQESEKLARDLGSQIRITAVGSIDEELLADVAKWHAMLAEVVETRKKANAAVEADANSKIAMRAKWDVAERGDAYLRTYLEHRLFRAQMNLQAQSEKSAAAAKAMKEGAAKAMEETARRQKELDAIINGKF